MRDLIHSLESRIGEMQTLVQQFQSQKDKAEAEQKKIAKRYGGFTILTSDEIRKKGSWKATSQEAIATEQRKLENAHSSIKKLMDQKARLEEKLQ